MELLFLRYFPGLTLADFQSPNGFPADLWDVGKALIKSFMERGM